MNRQIRREADRQVDRYVDGWIDRQVKQVQQKDRLDGLERQIRQIGERKQETIGQNRKVEKRKEQIVKNRIKKKQIVKNRIGFCWCWLVFAKLLHFLEEMRREKPFL